MSIDWNLVVNITIPIITLLLGAWLKRLADRQPRLTMYYGHVSAFKWTDNAGKRHDIFTHAVVVRNSGKKSARNVRFRHAVLPDFVISPAVEYSVVNLPEGGRDIVIPVMIPSEEVTVSYLYFPPVTVGQVNVSIRSDEVYAEPVPVLMQRQYGMAFNLFAATVFVIGLVAIAYVLIWTVIHFVHR